LGGFVGVLGLGAVGLLRGCSVVSVWEFVGGEVLWGLVFGFGLLECGCGGRCFAGLWGVMCWWLGACVWWLLVGGCFVVWLVLGWCLGVWLVVGILWGLLVWVVFVAGGGGVCVGLGVVLVVGSADMVRWVGLVWVGFGRWWVLFRLFGGLVLGVFGCCVFVIEVEDWGFFVCLWGVGSDLGRLGVVVVGG